MQSGKTDVTTYACSCRYEASSSPSWYDANETATNAAHATPPTWIYARNEATAEHAATWCNTLPLTGPNPNGGRLKER